MGLSEPPLPDALPTMAMERVRFMNLVAFALLATALLAYVAFHLLPIEIYTAPGLSDLDPDRGYRVWGEVLEFAKNPSADQGQDMIALAGFVCSAFLIVTCPFLVPLLNRSRWMWWIVVLASGAALCGLGGVLISIFYRDNHVIPGPGIPCLLAALVLNFLGLLFIRKETASRMSESYPARPPAS
jgi:hypothetical protein